MPSSIPYVLIVQEWRRAAKGSLAPGHPGPSGKFYLARLQVKSLSLIYRRCAISTKDCVSGSVRTADQIIC